MKKNKSLQPINNQTNFVLYTNPNGDVRLEVFLQNETLWLTQKMTAELFDVEVNTINYHLKEIFKSGELKEKTTIRKIRIVQNEGGRKVSREMDFYNLDAIIAVGYRVNSKRATQFRIWATQVLKDKGRLSKLQADKKALAEYNEFNKTQPIESDFEKEVKKLLKANKKIK